MHRKLLTKFLFIALSISSITYYRLPSLAQENLLWKSEEFNEGKNNASPVNFQKINGSNKNKNDFKKKILDSGNKKNSEIIKFENSPYKSKKDLKNYSFKKDNSSNFKPVKIQRNGYVKAFGPKISIIFKDIEAKEALRTIVKLGNYGFVYIPPTKEEKSKSSRDKEEISRKINLSFENTKYEVVLNSILMASGLQGKLENNIVFVGENVLSRGFKSEISKVYKLNNTSSSSVADYLASLGAVINKVSPTNTGSKVQNSFEKGINQDLSIKSYGANQGPLKGLIGTSDSRMETITLIGSLEKIQLAEKFIKFIDIPQKQVALSIKILDVNINDEEDLSNSFALSANNPTAYILNDDGSFDFALGDVSSWRLSREKGVSTLDLDNASKFNFLNWLNAKISSKETKVLASPTLILNETKDQIDGGQAISGNQGFSNSSIGRPYGNESFITVGTKVITNYTVTAGQNGAPASCEAEFGTSGLTFGAKIHKINSNEYITFSLSPELSSITNTMNVGTCGLVNILSVRRLDTGSIRVKNGQTLVLTGVISDTDTNITSKFPILGDVPVLGNLFKSTRKGKKKNELIILVTPNIINENYSYTQNNFSKYKLD